MGRLMVYVGAAVLVGGIGFQLATGVDVPGSIFWISGSVVLIASLLEGLHSRDDK